MDGWVGRSEQRTTTKFCTLLFSLPFCVDTLKNGESCPTHFFRPVALPAAVLFPPDFRSIKYEELSRIYVDCLLHFEFVPPLSPSLSLHSPAQFSSVQSSFCLVSCIFGQAQLTPNPAETDKELAGLEKPKEEEEESSVTSFIQCVNRKGRERSCKLERRPKIAYGVVRRGEGGRGITHSWRSILKFPTSHQSHYSAPMPH